MIRTTILHQSASEPGNTFRDYPSCLTIDLANPINGSYEQVICSWRRRYTSANINLDVDSVRACWWNSLLGTLWMKLEHTRVPPSTHIRMSAVGLL